MKKLFFTIVVLVLVLGGGAYALNTYIYNEKQGDPLPNGEQTEPSGVVKTFQDEMISRGVESLGAHPIEGFDAELLLGAYPGLKKADLDGVRSFEGIYSLENNELVHERTKDQPMTSAERTISTEGYDTLLKNLSQRLNMPASTDAEVMALIEEIAIPADIVEHIQSKRDHIIVHEPRPLTLVSSPLSVSGMARGPWYFEATFQLTLVNWDGEIIAESYVSAVLDPNDPESTWMTEEFVPFEGTIEFENPAFPGEGEDHFSRRGTLIFQKANPSGLPENDDALEIPVLFEAKN